MCPNVPLINYPVAIKITDEIKQTKSLGLASTSESGEIYIFFSLLLCIEPWIDTRINHFGIQKFNLRRVKLSRDAGLVMVYAYNSRKYALQTNILNSTSLGPGFTLNSVRKTTRLSTTTRFLFPFPKWFTMFTKMSYVKHVTIGLTGRWNYRKSND